MVEPIFTPHPKIDEMRRQRSCTRKRAFDTREDAVQKGSVPYRCHYCGKWHRATDKKY